MTDDHPHPRRRSTDRILPEVRINERGDGTVIISRAEAQLDKLEDMLDDYDALLQRLKDQLITKRGKR